MRYPKAEYYRLNEVVAAVESCVVTGDASTHLVNLSTATTYKHALLAMICAVYPLIRCKHIYNF
jgi:hypothetical protein